MKYLIIIIILIVMIAAAYNINKVEINQINNTPDYSVGQIKM